MLSNYKSKISAMQLTEQEKSMLNGEMGGPRRWAMEHMMRVGRFFDAEDFVEVTQAHIMADTESLGEAGVEFLEKMATSPPDQRRVRIPMITDPRGIDFCLYKRLKQTDLMASLEQRAIDAFEAMGILMTNTCINYQTIMPPVRGEHLAFGDTGVVIYCNSVLGAYSNFEGGPSALAAGLTGRTPRYALHLDKNRKATKRYRISHQPKSLSDWGALGAMVGARAGSYWEVPVIEGIETQPGSDDMKHMGAAMASFGSIPLFHIVGVTHVEATSGLVCQGEISLVCVVVDSNLKNVVGKY
jgi:predicted aconitase